MAASNSVREGYLVLADISGYTRFVTTTELEHAQSIIGELMDVMIHAVAPPLRFVKPEGDAVLCCADGRLFTDGERLLELLEVCYLQFATRQREMAAATTCACAACANIGTLDLKFVCHYGSFMAQPVGGVEDLAGPDVVLVFRLLKNSIAERTGNHAYVLFTDACRARMPAGLAMLPHNEEIESIGTVSGGVCDLRPVLEGQRQTAGEYIGSAEADFEFTNDYPASAAVLWQYFIDPDKLLEWERGLVAASNEPNERGRIAVGATQHCDHGRPTAHRIVDWRPFRSMTMLYTPVKSSLFRPAMTSTTEFIPNEDGTTAVSVRYRLQDRGWLIGIGMRLYAPRLRRSHAESAARLADLLRSDMTAVAGAQPPFDS